MEKTCQQYNLPYEQQFIHDLSGTLSVEIAAALIKKANADFDPAEIAENKYRNWKPHFQTPRLVDFTYKIFSHFIGELPIAVGTGAKRESAGIILSATDSSNISML